MKTNEQGGIDGYDAGKKIMGRKRSVLGRAPDGAFTFGCGCSFRGDYKTGMELRRFSTNSEGRSTTT